MKLRFASIPLSILAVCASVIAQTTAPDLPAKSIDELKDQARQRVEAQWHNISNIGQRDMADVLVIKKDQDRLLLASKLPYSQGTRLVTIRGYPGQAMYRFTPARFENGGFLVIERYDFSDPALIDVHEMVLSSPSIVQLVQDIELPDRTQSVALAQSATEEPAVVLRVQIVSEIDGSELVNLKLEAATLTALRREHPYEVDKYLRPLFRGLGQESAVFDVDARLAWEVVCDTWLAPADLKTKVSGVLAELDSDKYSVRAAAQDRLADMGQPAANYLMSIDRNSLSGEQSARVDEFLHPYRPATAQQAKALRTDKAFLLDCLNVGDEQLRAAVLVHLQNATGKKVVLDANLSPADRAVAIEKLRQELIPPPATAPSGQEK